MDMQLLGPLAPTTKNDYKKALVQFVSWLELTGMDFDDAESLDDCVVTYFYEQNLRPAAAETIAAALEKVCPRVHHKLAHAHSVTKVLHSSYPRVYTAPLPLRLCVILAYDWAVSGYPRAAAALLVQWLFGLRPSEALALRSDDLLAGKAPSPEEPGQIPTVLIQSQHRTKAGRPQFSMALGPWVEWANIVIAYVHATSPPGVHICNITTVTSLTSWLRRSRRKLQIRAEFTAHSPRVGWATESRMRGVPFNEILEAGRWASATSFRGYLDVVASMAAQTNEPRYVALAEYLLMDLRARFPWNGR